MTIGFSVVGADHLHLFTLVGGLVDAGARPEAPPRGSGGLPPMCRSAPLASVTSPAPPGP